jgi:hypothetical protein
MSAITPSSREPVRQLRLLHARGVAYDLVAQDRLLQPIQRLYHLARRSLRRVEVTPVMPPGRGRAPESVLVSEIDGRPFRLGRAGHRVGDERQQPLQIQHAREHAARLTHRPLIIRVRAIDVAIEEVSTSVSANR